MTRATYSSLELLLALANPCDLRVGVDDGRDAVVVDVWVAAEHAFHRDDTLVLCLVCEHRTVDDVTNSIDAVCFESEIMIG